MTPLKPRKSRNAVTMRPTISTETRPTASPSIVRDAVDPAGLPSRSQTVRSCAYSPARSSAPASRTARAAEKSLMLS
jgi:hypothetical protein